MNDPGSAGGGYDDTPSGSPKRKRVRSKYTVKACVLCRRSKLKCSGENPCRRCQDNGRRCFYSEDQTAAEALQNLSRPAPSQPPGPGANGSEPSRRSVPSRTGPDQRRTSDASVLGGSMEARMARMEAMMEALVQERGIRITPRESLERDCSPAEGYYADRDTNSLRLSMSLAPTAQHDSLEHAPFPFPFPSPDEYQTYLGTFFDHVNPFHPCIDEVEFRERSQRMLSFPPGFPSDANFLALNLAIFACVDGLAPTDPRDVKKGPPGWQWYQAADHLAAKRLSKSSEDLSLIQFAIVETLYFTILDRPNAAYKAIGLASRLCFQLGVHRQPVLDNRSQAERHLRQCVFRVVFTLDRQIALSCRRPHSIHDRHFDLAGPVRHSDEKYWCGKKPIPLLYCFMSHILYLNCTFQLAEIAGEVYDHVFAASPWTLTEEERTANIAKVEARIRQFADVDLAHCPLRPNGTQPYIQSKQYAILRTRINHLRLLLYMEAMVSLSYPSDIGSICGDLALDTVARIRSLPQDSFRAPSVSRLYISGSLSSAIVTLGALLVRDLTSLGLASKARLYAEDFKNSVDLLRDIGSFCHMARRFIDDLKDLIGVVMAMLDGGSPERVPANIQALFPYNRKQVEDIGLNDLEEWNVPTGHRCGVPWI